MASQLVYLCGSAWWRFGLTLWTRRIALGTIAFVVLALSPSLFGTVASRIYRESLTPALAITILGLTFSQPTWWHDDHQPSGGQCGPSAECGLPGGSNRWLSLTRADSICLWGMRAHRNLQPVFRIGRSPRERFDRDLGWLRCRGGAKVWMVPTLWQT